MNYPLKSPGLASKDDLQAKISFPDYSSWNVLSNITLGSTSNEAKIMKRCFAVIVCENMSSDAGIINLNIDGKNVAMANMAAGGICSIPLPFKGGEKIYFDSTVPYTAVARCFNYID